MFPGGICRWRRLVGQGRRALDGNPLRRGYWSSLLEIRGGGDRVEGFERRSCQLDQSLLEPGEVVSGCD